MTRRRLVPILAVILAMALGGAAGFGLARLFDFPAILATLLAGWWGLSAPVGVLVGCGCSMGETEAV